MNLFTALHLVDILALGLVAAGAIQGFCRRLSGELARLVGMVFIFIASISLHDPVGTWMLAHTRLEGQSAHAVAFIATVGLAILIMLPLRFVTQQLFQLVLAERFDKSIGTLAGMLRMSVFVCIFFLIMNLVPHPYLNRIFGEESAVGRLVLQAVPTVREKLDNTSLPLPQETDTIRKEDAS